MGDMSGRIHLLRAVNVGGAKLPMAELREVAASLGATDVRTYIASGNLICDPPGDPAHAVGIGDGRTAVLLDYEAHAFLSRAGTHPDGRVVTGISAHAIGSPAAAPSRWDGAGHTRRR